MNINSKLECAKDRFLMKAMGVAIMPSYINMDSESSRNHVFESLCELQSRFEEYEKLLSEFIRESK